jgi:hypothetical protein
MLTAILTIHAASTLFMVGLIWFVQVVHYPLMQSVGAANYSSYQEGHMMRTGYVVGPVMVTEAVSAAALVALPSALPTTLTALGLVALGVIWLSTASQQVPRHRALLAAFDEGLHRTLVQSNWIRTFFWTLRGALALWLLTQTV